ncbi:MAG TPA: mechanosensitive ion channel [Anaerolineae bacterium]|nr:mechanosensitive ion channel [Anaerolineae bacterium]
MGIADTLKAVLTFELISRALAVAATWLAVYILVRYLSRWLERLNKAAKGYGIDSGELKLLDMILDYAIIAAGVVVTLSILDLTSLLYSALTAAGVATVMIGFAVKDVAANFVSGLFILLDRPFVVGDRIKVKEHMGRVERISLRSTRIITSEGEVVTIPNSLLATNPIVNYSVGQKVSDVHK